MSWARTLNLFLTLLSTAFEKFDLPGNLQSRRHFVNVCHDLMQKPFDVTIFAQKSFILVIGLKKMNIFIFPTVKIGCKLYRNGRVGKLKADFQQVLLIPIV